uniref:DUF5993 family protein n=1 Tax=Burkholderia arboris TaxID=488730 RepID=UPI003BEF2097
MFMFLPFLISLSVIFSAFTRRRALSYWLWAILLLVTIMSFKHHATNALNLSF